MPVSARLDDASSSFAPALTGCCYAVQELSLRIMGAQTVQQPSTHTVYNVQCSAGVVRWEVRKRFSDFVQVNSSRVCFHSGGFRVWQAARC